MAGNTGIVYPAFLELLPEDVQANTDLVAVSQFVWTTDDPEQLAWIEAFRDRFGRDPDVTAMDGYDAAFVLKKAIEAAGSTENTALQQALNEVEYEGVGGYISFDETGQAVRSLAIARLTPKDGKGFDVVKEVEPGEY
jgi:branched-chain amino acid transport system substrate-binding protein